MTDFLLDGPAGADRAVLLAHGAGAPMDSAFMETFAALLAERGFRAARFEFAYMAARRQGGGRKPPPGTERLMEEYRTAIADLGWSGRLVIGGKSLGGRVASMIAQEEYDAGRVAGLLCLGYPFHPPGKPDNLRTAHLTGLAVPTLIVQGARDPFGNREEVPGYGLPGAVTVHWAEDGDHGLAPRKASGLTADDTWRDAAAAIAAWAGRLAA